MNWAAVSLLFASFIGGATHAAVAWVAWRGKGPSFKGWTVYLSVVSALFFAASISYLGLVSPMFEWDYLTQHIPLVRVLGVLLWLHPSLMLFSLVRQTDRVLRDTVKFIKENKPEDM